jgi:hypothetical protein
MVTREADAVEFCDDSELGYRRSRTRAVPGERLVLDEQYRLAHLPLVAPDHPRVIATRAGTTYNRGQRPRSVSLVMPVPWRALFAADAYQELERDLRASSFAPRIAWDLVERRRERLHATICGSLESDRVAAVTEQQRRELAELGPIQVELRGLFSGSVNVGRLYLRVYPERRGGLNPLREMQRILGRPTTDLYVVGLHNLTSDLSPAEAEALAALIERWWDRPILQFTVSSLWLLWATDDLVLQGGVEQVIPLTVWAAG